MSEQTLKFNDVIVNKKEFHVSKRPVALSFSRHRPNSCI